MKTKNSTSVTSRCLLAATFALLTNGCAPDKPAEEPRSSPPPVVEAASPSPPAKPKPEPPKEEEEPDPLAGVTPIQLGPQEVRILVDALPLATENIDFGRIDRFFKLYAAVVAGYPEDERAPVVSAMKAANKHMRVTMKRLSRDGSMRIFPIDNATKQSAYGWAADPPVYNVYPLLTNLRAVVQETGQVVLHFHSAHRGAMTQQQRAVVERQSVGTGSIMTFNFSDIDSILRQLPASKGSR